jgi:hypothetical protein
MLDLVDFDVLLLAEYECRPQFRGEVHRGTHKRVRETSTDLLSVERF